MSSVARPLFAPAILLALSTGCASEFDDPHADLEHRLDDCTFNSPRINSYLFPELHLGGSPNFDGVTLVGLRPPNEPDTYKLSTDIREAIVALDEDNQVRASGAELVGWRIVLEKNGVELVGFIEAYDNTRPMWNDAHRPMTVYAISFEDPIDPTQGKNVCPQFYMTPGAQVLTVIRGQTYDRDAKSVGEIDPNWVTFACADEAAYKARALGYHQGDNFPGTGLPATRDQQDATLKMITADYCGIGYAFTEHNIPLAWENTAQTVTAAQHGPIEAMWGKDGAICLNEPRYFPRSFVETECGDSTPPPCNTIDPDDHDVEWISYREY